MVPDTILEDRLSLMRVCYHINKSVTDTQTDRHTDRYYSNLNKIFTVLYFKIMIAAAAGVDKACTIPHLPTMLSHSLFNNLLLMKAKAYTMWFKAKMKKEALERVEMLNNKIEK